MTAEAKTRIENILHAPTEPKQRPDEEFWAGGFMEQNEEMMFGEMEKIHEVGEGQRVELKIRKMKIRRPGQSPFVWEYDLVVAKGGAAKKK
jgi:hypothetical protein